MKSLVLFVSSFFGSSKMLGMPVSEFDGELGESNILNIPEGVSGTGLEDGPELSNKEFEQG
ncbi:TPA: hypothetical protein HA219_02510 [Candidatus Woesearchaeota archaeon]|nr:hypothetical protein [Candidatus Woesearchaeota archaeon]